MIVIELQFKVADIAAACGGKLLNLCGDEIIENIITDSRQSCVNSVFVAIKGCRFDGHDFVRQAIETKSLCCVVDRAGFENLPIIVVKDTLIALRDIATFYRNQFDLPIVGVTGSVGKTTVKEMIAKVLAFKYNVLKNKGNFNNAIGVPLTIFDLKAKHQIAVIEIGMSALGEISNLTSIVKPDTAVITNIGVSHIGSLFSKENILKAKLEILDGLGKTGTVILNGDDELLTGVAAKLPFEVRCFGIKNQRCDVTAKNIVNSPCGCRFSVTLDGKTREFSMKIPGVHNVYNALSALLVGRRYGVELDDIVEAIGNFSSEGLRQTVIKTAKYTIIQDCYNASTHSMLASLELLVELGADRDNLRTVAVLGDMLELGAFSQIEHKKVGEAVAEAKVDVLVTVGAQAAYIALAAKERGMTEVFEFRDKQSAMEKIFSILQMGDVILFKASRALRLEELSFVVAEYENEEK